jgi:hypothetical protein
VHLRGTSAHLDPFGGATAAAVTCRRVEAEGGSDLGIGEVIDGCPVGVAQVRHPVEVRSRGTQIPRGLHDCAPRAPGVRSRLPFTVGAAEGEGRKQTRRHAKWEDKEQFGAWLLTLDGGHSTRPTAKVAKNAKILGADGGAGRKFPLVVVALAETTNGTNATNPGMIGFVGFVVEQIPARPTAATKYDSTGGSRGSREGVCFFASHSLRCLCCLLCPKNLCTVQRH